MPNAASLPAVDQIGFLWTRRQPTPSRRGSAPREQGSPDDRGRGGAPTERGAEPSELDDDPLALPPSRRADPGGLARSAPGRLWSPQSASGRLTIHGARPRARRWRWPSASTYPTSRSSLRSTVPLLTATRTSRTPATPTTVSGPTSASTLRPLTATGTATTRRRRASRSPRRPTSRWMSTSRAAPSTATAHSRAGPSGCQTSRLVTLSRVAPRHANVLR